MQQTRQFSLEGKTILITGASSGIGLACAEAFFNAGASLVLSGKSPEKLERAAKKICSESAAKICADFENEESLSALAKAAPQLDALVSCAGVNLPSMLKFAKT